MSTSSSGAQEMATGAPGTRWIISHAGGAGVALEGAVEQLPYHHFYSQTPVTESC
jgi:hypothetical protein